MGVRFQGSGDGGGFDMRLFQMQYAKCTAVLLLLMLLLSLFSCGGVSDPIGSGTSGGAGGTASSPESPEGTGGAETDPYEILLGGDRVCRVVYPARHRALVDVAAAIAMAIPNGEMANDGSAESELEILIGGTSRAQSAEAKALLGNRDILITVIEGKLVIYASTDINYWEAVTYMEDLCRGKETVGIPSDLDIRGTLDRISLKPSGETVGAGKTTVGFRFTVDEPRSQAGIYIGNDREGQGCLGFHGLCLLLEEDRFVLYRAAEELVALGERRIPLIQYGDVLSMRLEMDGAVLRAYFLDDAAGIEPWPEIELPLEADLTGYAIGGIVKSGMITSDRMEISRGAETVPMGKTYTNAVLAGYADPDVIYHDGYYYLYATGSAEGYRVHRSTDLVTWTDVGVAAAYGSLYGITKNYWAPDVEYIDGKFYMVVSCNETLGLAVSDSPTGPFVATTAEPLYRKSIDGHIFVDDDGRIYLYFVSWRGSYGIYGVEVDRETMMPIASSERLIIRPTEDWEKHQGNVTEGPYMLKRNGIYYMTYSGSHYQSQKYAVGYAVSDSPLGTYEKYDLNPIMIGTGYIAGVGHHCIITKPDGEMMIVYHCHNNLSQVHARRVCIDRIRFAPVTGGIDRLEVYGPTVTPQEYND